jgi:hypothetical protein
VSSIARIAVVLAALACRGTSALSAVTPFGVSAQPSISATSSVSGSPCTPLTFRSTKEGGPCDRECDHREEWRSSQQRPWFGVRVFKMLLAPRET